MLKVTDLKSGYGDVTVLKGLNFEVQHEIYAVLGANGAGKSTLMKTLAKLLTVREGTIEFYGEDVTHTAPYTLAAKGLGYVPQEGNVFPDLSVRENLSIGSLIGERSREEKLEEVIALFPDIGERINQSAGCLSGGERQMVAVGRALMQDPKMILLDEPTAGLSPKYVDNFFKRIEEIHKQKDVSVMLAEQNAVKALEICDRVMLLSLGKIMDIEDKKDVSVEKLREGYRI
ncbi:MAG: ABC transporter ATP-binding protein [Spirochaetota bacterium]